MSNIFPAPVSDWDNILRPDYPARKACEWINWQLDNILQFEDTLSTTQLVEKLYPMPLYPTVGNSLARKRLFSLLSTISKEGNFAEPLAPRPGKGWSKGKMVRPLCWRKIVDAAAGGASTWAEPSHLDGPVDFRLDETIGRLDLLALEVRFRLNAIEKHVGLLTDVDEHGTAELVPEDQSGK